MMAWNHVQMRVGNGLAGSLANVDADVEAVRHSVRFNVAPYYRQKAPNSGLFLPGECEEISLMPPGNNQAVSPTQRKRIEKGDREIVRADKVSAI
jgi:hypothetical protein